MTGEIPDPPEELFGTGWTPSIRPDLSFYEKPVPFDEEDGDWEGEPYEAPPWLQEIPEIAEAPPPLTARDRERFRAALEELARRRSESLKLFRPLPEQERFFASDAGERIALGGNRGGKTTVTVVEIARAVTGQDPYDKYPKRDGKFIIVGLDLKHCSKVFYKKLFQPGAFKIIKDVVTGEWRSYNPGDPGDLARSDEAKLAPPLIPRRFYDPKKIAWENKKDEIPTTIPLKNGWTLFFFTSKGAPPQGWNVDGVAFDEEIEHPLWYPEMAARLLDNRTVDTATRKVRGGKFIWSATPQAGTQQLYDLKVRADEQRESEIADLADGKAPPPPTVECYQFGMLDNNFVAEDAKRDFIAKMSPEEYAVRVEGKFAMLGLRVYGEFDPRRVHSCDPFVIPEDWSRFMFVDPGHQVCAALFVAMAPPSHEMGGQLVVYDELYVRKANAKVFADAVAKKVEGVGMVAFYIDHQAGRQTNMASGRTNEDIFIAEFKRAKVRSDKTGHGFMWGASDVKAGILAVRQAMYIQEGRPRLVVMREKCPNLLWEAERYCYKKNPDGYVTDDPIQKNNHLMDCLRYACSAALKYVRPAPRKSRLSYAGEALKRKRERAAHRARGDDPHVNVG